MVQIHACLHTHTFNDPLSGTTQVSRYQKGKTNLDFTKARNSEWQWHQLGRMQVCTLLQTDNHASTPPLSVFTGRMPFLPPNQQRWSTEGSKHWRLLGFQTEKATQKVNKSVKPRPSALNMTLPAYAAERGACSRYRSIDGTQRPQLYQSIYAARARAQQQTSRTPMSIDGTGRKTDSTVT